METEKSKLSKEESKVCETYLFECITIDGLLLLGKVKKDFTPWRELPRRSLFVHNRQEESQPSHVTSRRWYRPPRGSVREDDAFIVVVEFISSTSVSVLLLYSRCKLLSNHRETIAATRRKTVCTSICCLVVLRTVPPFQ